MVSMGKYIFRQRRICIATIGVLCIMIAIKYLMMVELTPTLSEQYEGLKTTFLSLGFRFSTNEQGQIAFDRMESVAFESETLIINLLLLYYYHN